MGVVRAICISSRKVSEKHSIEEGCFLENFGIKGDAHGGKWHRQVSLLSYDKIKEFNDRGAGVEDGAFGENLVVEGIDFSSLPVGTRFYAGDAVLVSCVGIRIFDGTDFYVCIFILYVGDQKEWFPDRILHSYCGGNGDQCCHRSIYPGTGYYPVCR